MSTNPNGGSFNDSQSKLASSSIIQKALIDNFDKELPKLFKSTFEKIFEKGIYDQKSLKFLISNINSDIAKVISGTMTTTNKVLNEELQNNKFNLTQNIKDALKNGNKKYDIANSIVENIIENADDAREAAIKILKDAKISDSELQILMQQSTNTLVNNTKHIIGELLEKSVNSIDFSQELENIPRLQLTQMGNGIKGISSSFELLNKTINSVIDKGASEFTNEEKQNYKDLQNNVENYNNYWKTFDDNITNRKDILGQLSNKLGNLSGSELLNALDSISNNKEGLNLSTESLKGSQFNDTQKKLMQSVKGNFLRHFKLGTMKDDGTRVGQEVASVEDIQNLYENIGVNINEAGAKSLHDDIRAIYNKTKRGTNSKNVEKDVAELILSRISVESIKNLIFDNGKDKANLEAQFREHTQNGTIAYAKGYSGLTRGFGKHLETKNEEAVILGKILESNTKIEENTGSAGALIGYTKTIAKWLGYAVGVATPLYHDQINSINSGVGGASILSSGYNSAALQGALKGISSSVMYNKSNGNARLIAALGGMGGFAEFLSNEDGLGGDKLLGSANQVAEFRSDVLTSLLSNGLTINSAKEQTGVMQSLFGKYTRQNGITRDQFQSFVSERAGADSMKLLISQSTSLTDVMKQQVDMLNTNLNSFSKYNITLKEATSLLEAQNKVNNGLFMDRHEEANKLMTAASVAGLGHLAPAIQQAYFRKDSKAIERLTRTIIQKSRGIGASDDMSDQVRFDIISRNLSSNSMGKTMLDNPILANEHSMASAEELDKIKNLNEPGWLGNIGVSLGNFANSVDNPFGSILKAVGGLATASWGYKKFMNSKAGRSLAATKLGRLLSTGTSTSTLAKPFVDITGRTSSFIARNAKLISGASKFAGPLSFLEPGTAGYEEGEEYAMLSKGRSNTESYNLNPDDISRLINTLQENANLNKQNMEKLNDISKDPTNSRLSTMQVINANSSGI